MKNDKKCAAKGGKMDDENVDKEIGKMDGEKDGSASAGDKETDKKNGKSDGATKLGLHMRKADSKDKLETAEAKTDGENELDEKKGVKQKASEDGRNIAAEVGT